LSKFFCRRIHGSYIGLISPWAHAHGYMLLPLRGSLQIFRFMISREAATACSHGREPMEKIKLIREPRMRRQKNSHIFDLKHNICLFFVFFFTIFQCPFVDAAQVNDSDRSFVTCQLEGQLGNQLFEIATTLAYAWDYDVEPYFSSLNEPRYTKPYNKEHLFFRLNTEQPPRLIQNTYTESKWYSADRIPFKRDLLLKGYLQSWKYFDHYRDRLLQVFAPLESDRVYLQNKYGDLIANENTVAVHVRTQSFLVHQKGVHPFMGFEYYRRAFELFPKETLFVIFSDRTEWCQIHFSEWEKNFIFIDGNDHIQDLFLMSLMKHQVIANSTLSWWAAYINENPNKIVVAPRHWMRADYPDCIPDHALFNDLYLPGWQIVENDITAPYPEDLMLYGPSKSIDNYNHPIPSR